MSGGSEWPSDTSGSSSYPLKTKGSGVVFGIICLGRVRSPPYTLDSQQVLRIFTNMYGKSTLQIIDTARTKINEISINSFSESLQSESNGEGSSIAFFALNHPPFFWHLLYGFSFVEIWHPTLQHNPFNYCRLDCQQSGLLIPGLLWGHIHSSYAYKKFLLATNGEPIGLRTSGHQKGLLVWPQFIVKCKLPLPVTF